MPHATAASSSFALLLITTAETNETFTVSKCDLLRSEFCGMLQYDGRQCQEFEHACLASLLCIDPEVC